MTKSCERVLVRLVALFGLAAAVLFVLAPGPVAAQAAATFTPSEEAPEDLPAGPGRDETFYACTACHNFKLVSAQGMSRRQWDDSLTWMTQRHGMPPLEGQDRELVLGYLEAKFPPSGHFAGSANNPFADVTGSIPATPGAAPAARGWQNPFLNR